MIRRHTPLRWTNVSLNAWFAGRRYRVRWDDLPSLCFQRHA